MIAIAQVTSASNPALPQTKTAAPPTGMSAVAASPGAPAAAPAPLACKKADQQDGMSKKATFLEVCVLSGPAES